MDLIETYTQPGLTADQWEQLAGLIGPPRRQEDIERERAVDELRECGAI